MNIFQLILYQYIGSLVFNFQVFYPILLLFIKKTEKIEN